MNFFVLVILSLFPCHSFSFSPVFLSPTPVSLPISLPLLSLFLSFSLASLSLSLSFSRSCLSFYFSLSHPCRLPLLLHSCLLFIFLSPLSLLLPLCGCLSFFYPCLFSYLSLSHHASLFLWFSLARALSLYPIPVFLFLPPLSFYLSRTPVSLPISLSLFLSFSLPSLYPSLSHTHASLPICLSFYLFLSLFLSHSCLSFYLSSFSLPSLSPIFVFHSLSLRFFSLSLSPAPVSLLIFFFSPSLSLYHPGLSSIFSLPP